MIGFSPGGYIDLTSRLVAGPLAAALGQQVVVDNRSGAGGVVGTEIAAHAPPDGYTLTIGSIGTHAINQTLYSFTPTQRTVAAGLRFDVAKNVALKFQYDRLKTGDRSNGRLQANPGVSVRDTNVDIVSLVADFVF